VFLTISLICAWRRSTVEIGIDNAEEEIMAKVLYEKEGHVVDIILNRPNTLNAYDIEMLRELESAFDKFNEDSDAWVAIVSSAVEKSFCVGYDMKQDSSKIDEAPPPRTIWGGDLKVYKPIVAAINGYCLGGGMDFAMACDIIISSTDAKFGLTMARVGLIPHYPLSFVLRLGFKGLELMLTGELIDAHQAQRIGLVSKVVERSELLAEARNMVNKLLENSPTALRAIKEAVDRGMEYIYKPAYELGLEAHSKNLSSWDRQEGMAAFKEKRKPNYRGF